MPAELRQCGYTITALAVRCLQVNELSLQVFLWPLSFLCRNSPASERMLRTKPDIRDRTVDKAPFSTRVPRPRRTHRAVRYWHRVAHGRWIFLAGSFIPQASLSEGFFLLYTTLSARVLFVKCSYFPIVCLADRPGGVFLPLPHRQLRCSRRFYCTSALLCWAMVLLSQTQILTHCHRHNSNHDPNPGLGWGRAGGAAPGAKQHKPGVILMF